MRSYIYFRYLSLKRQEKMNDNPCCQSMIQTFLVIFNCIAFVRSFNHHFLNVLAPSQSTIDFLNLTIAVFNFSIEMIEENKDPVIFYVCLLLSLQVGEFLLLPSMLSLGTDSPSSASPPVKLASTV